MVQQPFLEPVGVFLVLRDQSINLLLLGLFWRGGHFRLPSLCIIPLKAVLMSFHHCRHRRRALEAALRWSCIEGAHSVAWSLDARVLTSTRCDLLSGVDLELAPLPLRLLQEDCPVKRLLLPQHPFKVLVQHNNRVVSRAPAPPALSKALELARQPSDRLGHRGLSLEALGPRIQGFLELTGDGFPPDSQVSGRSECPRDVIHQRLPDKHLPHHGSLHAGEGEKIQRAFQPCSWQVERVRFNCNGRWDMHQEILKLAEGPLFVVIAAAKEEHDGNARR
mmetsp:Transcript_5616/g.14066  ORF Transcript_5616/g.14066 Transcript_5616/m.14066 type:complete len:278 (+) Transcript_5616:115-948(+)